MLRQFFAQPIEVRIATTAYMGSARPATLATLKFNYLSVSVNGMDKTWSRCGALSCLYEEITK